MIDEFLAREREKEIEFLRKLVRTPSVNPYVKDPIKSSPYDPVELAVAELIYEELEASGFSPRFEGVSDLRPNVVVELGKGKRTLIFNGHMDTVLPHEDYSFNPFSAYVKDGRLYGLGSLDMKASLVAFIWMLKALARTESELNGRVLVQFVVDEEPMAASHFGTFHLLEKGYTGDAAIVGEPGMDKLIVANRGGYRFVIETFGQAVHTGSREWETGKEGKNAISEMFKVIRALQDFKFPETSHPLFPARKSVMTFPVFIEGGRAINIVPDYCRAFGDARLLPGITEEWIENEIRSRLDSLGIKYKLKRIVYVPPAVTKEDAEIVKVTRDAVQEVTGSRPPLAGSGPWSDLWMFVSRGIPAVNLGPEGSGIHAKDEWVDLASLFDVTRIYARIARKFLG